MKYIISIVLLAFAATVNAQLVFTNESIRVAVLKGSRENKFIATAYLFGAVDAVKYKTVCPTSSNYMDNIMEGYAKLISSREFEDENAAKTITVLASQMYPCK